MGHQVGRATGGLLVEMIGLILSMALVIVAAALPATSSSLVGAKVRSIPLSAARLRKHQAPLLICVHDADRAFLQLHHNRDHRGVGAAPQEAPQAGADRQSGRAIRRVHTHHPVSLISSTSSTRTAWHTKRRAPHPRRLCSAVGPPMSSVLEEAALKPIGEKDSSPSSRRSAKPSLGSLRTTPRRMAKSLSVCTATAGGSFEGRLGSSVDPHSDRNHLYVVPFLVRVVVPSNAGVFSSSAQVRAVQPW